MMGTWHDVGRLDELGRLDTPVHRIDARVKAIATIAFIVTVMSFGRYEVAALMPFFLYPVALVSIGRIPPGYIFKKILVAAPFAVMVGIFNPVFDRQVFDYIGSFPLTGGWLSFASIMVRFALTVSAALALVATTGMHRLCAGLERMGVPRALVVQLLFLHRYLFVISGEGSRMLRSLALRGADSRAVRMRVYVPLVGHLLVRSMDRADRVYRAMVARGFDGQIRVERPISLSLPDLVFAGGWILFFLAVRTWNFAAILGRLLTGVVS